MLPGRSGHRTQNDTRLYRTSQVLAHAESTACQKIGDVLVAGFQFFEVLRRRQVAVLKGLDDGMARKVELAERQFRAQVLECLRQRCGCGCVACIDCAFELGKRFIFRELAQRAVVDDAVVAVVDRARSVADAVLEGFSSADCHDVSFAGFAVRWKCAVVRGSVPGGGAYPVT